MAAAKEYGPSLPPDLSAGAVESDQLGKASGSRDSLPSYGPCLPQELGGRETSELSETFGPVLPPSGVCTGQKEGGEGHSAVQNSVSEESAAVEDEEEKEVELIGPSLPDPSQQTCDLQQIKESFESRSKAMQDRISSKGADSGPKREEWMMELPPGFRIAGVGARKFKSQDTDLGDRSVWTDTPADRERKRLEQSRAKERREGEGRMEPVEQTVMSKRDREMEELATEYNKGRTQSLFAAHSRKRAADPAGQERRPFDRERDLQITKVVPAAKRQDMMKDSSHKLHSKFTHSSQQKYL